MIRLINKKDFTNFIDFCKTRCTFSDFYITENNHRLFLTNYSVASKVFQKSLKHNDKAFILEQHDDIHALCLFVGFSDKSPRKYLKMLYNNEKLIPDLLRYIMWNIPFEFFIKVKKTNSLVRYFNKKIFAIGLDQTFGFKFVALRENGEILFKFIPNPNRVVFPTHFKDDETE